MGRFKHIDACCMRGEKGGGVAGEVASEAAGSPQTSNFLPLKLQGINSAAPPSQSEVPATSALTTM